MHHHPATSALRLGLAALALCPLSMLAPCNAQEQGATCQVQDAATYTLGVGEKLFDGQPYVWSALPQAGQDAVAWRVALDPAEPVKVTTTRPGQLVAALWRWDYGFLQHVPDDALTLNGWVRREGKPAKIADATSPFDTLPVYRLALTAGEHEVRLAEHFGQWVLIGFEPDDQVTSDALPPAVTLIDAKTAHNVYDPGGEVVVKSSRPVQGLTLHRQGKLIARSESDRIRLPSDPGRYCLAVTFDGAAQLEPVTVGYGPVEKPGWPEGFFPVSFYGVRGAPFNPNPARHAELDVLAQFELGANVFNTVRRRNVQTPKQVDALLSALGVRRIIKLPQCRWPMREKKDMDDSRAVGIIMFEIGHHGQSKRSDVLGLYVEDETPPEYAFRLEAVEKAFRARIAEWPDRHLLYCLGGAGDWRDAVVWRIAGSTVQMARAYPIRQAHRNDMVARARQIRAELGDMICNFQTRKTDPGTPFWIVLQAFGTNVRPPLWDPPNAAQLRMMAHMALARGVRAMTWFGYGSTPNGGEDLYGISRWPFVPADDRYDEVARINARVHKLRPLLTAWQWVGPVPQKSESFDVQKLRHDDGREFVYVTNLSFEEARAGSIDLPDKPGGMEVSLDPGDGTIIDLSTLK